MKRIYSAATLADAHLIVGLLAREGLAARVFNENAQGGLGEIPFTQAWPEVWIENEVDAPRALALIRALEQTSAKGQLKCKACGEYSPDTFELCWNCGGELES